MRNINELMGIIKGINFDGTVNEKEIQSLTKWVDRNRNLAYENEDAELIKLVDEILADGIVADYERENLLAVCALYEEECSDENAKIYELNGIIEGITCDGVINDDEIFKLKEWISIHGNELKKDYHSRELCKIINEIVEDKIITENERQSLLDILRKRIEVSKVNIKIEFLRKKVKEGKNIGIDLIDLLDNDDAIKLIHDRAEKQLRATLNSYSGVWAKDSEIVFISLVLIGMLEYDGNFYKHVSEEYPNIYARYSEQKIEGIIRTVLNKYKQEGERLKGNRLINIALYNAIVPGAFLSHFFEFIFDIYKQNFEYELSDSLYDEFELIYEGLRTSMSSDGDDLQLDITKKTYKLIKTTKELVTDKTNVDSIIKLSIIIVKLIDKYIWNEPLKIVNPYLKRGFDNWVSNVEENERNKNRDKSSLRSRWEPKYVFRDGKVWLIPQIHTIKNEYDYRKIVVEVYNGDEKIYEDTTPDIREIIGGYKIYIDKICIDKPLGNIAYKLMCGRQIIYDSREKLRRKVMIFSVEGKEIKNNSDYEGKAVICHDVAISLDEDWQTTDYYKLANYNAKIGDALIIGTEIFNFSTLLKPGIVGTEYTNYSILELDTNKIMPVYKDIKYIMFENAEKFGVQYDVIVDGKEHRLEHFEYTITERNGAKKYLVNIDDIESGIHTIKIVEKYKNKSKHLFTFDFAVDKKLNVDELKLDDDTYLVSVDTDLSESVMMEINVSDYSSDLIKFKNTEKQYQYNIPFNFEIYRISESKWKSINKDVWIGDINQSSNICIFGNIADEICVYSDQEKMLEEPIKLKHIGIYGEVNVGFLMSYKEEYDYVTIVLVKDGVRKGTIFCYNRAVINSKETQIRFDPLSKNLYITPVYHGRGNIYLIMKKGENEVYKSEFIKSNAQLSISDVNSFIKYDILFYEKKEGLSLLKDREIICYKKVFYAWSDFVGRTFKVKTAYFDQFIQKRMQRKEYNFKYTYINIIDQNNDGTFIGEIFNKTVRGDFKLYNVNPIQIEMCSDVVDGEIEIAMFKEGDGLLLDFKYHNIMNSIEDDKAPDIFSYIIDVSEEVQNE